MDDPKDDPEVEEEKPKRKKKIRETPRVPRARISPSKTSGQVYLSARSNRVQSWRLPGVPGALVILKPFLVLSA